MNLIVAALLHETHMQSEGEKDTNGVLNRKFHSCFRNNEIKIFMHLFLEDM